MFTKTHAPYFRRIKQFNIKVIAGQLKGHDIISAALMALLDCTMDAVTSRL